MSGNSDDRSTMKEATSNASLDYLIMKSLNDIMQFESNHNNNKNNKGCPPKSPDIKTNIPFSNKSDESVVVIEDSFLLYKQKVQTLLQLLLSKLEDNYSYQTYLESEIESLESACAISEENRFHRRRSSRVSDSFIDKENRKSLSELINKDNVNEEKELLNKKIESLENELDKCKDENKNLHEVRHNELNSVKIAMKVMQERISALNKNYSGDNNNDDDDDDDDDNF